MAIPERDGAATTYTLGNEAMYRKTWATFVDGAISKHRQHEAGGGEGSAGGGGGGGGEGGGRIELRDVMVLEEVLAKIENAAVGGGYIDHEKSSLLQQKSPAAVGSVGDDDSSDVEGERSCAAVVSSPWNDGLLRRNDSRASLQTTAPGLPAMFDNPRPSFFAAMYKCGPQPPLDAQSSRPSTTGNDSHGIGPRNSRDSGRCSPLSPHTGETKEEGHHQYSPQGDSQGGRDTDPRKPVGFSTGVKGSAFFPASDAVGPTKGADGQVFLESDAPYSRECGVASSSSKNSSRGAAVVVSSGEDSRQCSEWPLVGSEVGVVQPISRDLLPKLMESLHLGGRSRAPSPVACNGGGHMQPALSGSNACHDIYTAAAAAAVAEAACEEQQNAGTPQDQTRGSQQDEDGAPEEDGVTDSSPEREEEAQQQSISYFVDTLQQANPMEDFVLSQLSVQLNATRIEDASSDIAIEGRERRLSSATSDVKAGAVGVTNPKAGLHDRDRNGGRSVTDEEERLPCTLSKENSGIMVGVTALEHDDDFDQSPPEDPWHGQRAQEDEHSRSRVDAESPELARLGSASQSADRSSHRDRSFGHGPLGEVADSRACGSGDGSNDAAVFSLAQSPDGAPIVEGEGEGESEVFGSMPSLDIGGFGRFDGCDDDVHALSPLALAVSFDDGSGGDDRGDGGGGSGARGRDLSSSGVGGDCCGLSPVRSARSESTVDPDGGGGPSSSPRARRTLFADEAGESEEDDEDITLTPEISRSSRLNDDQPLFPTGTGGSMEENEEGGGCERGSLDTSAAGIEEGGSGVMPPPPPRQPSLARQRKEQRQPDTPEDRRSPANTLRRSTALSDGTNTPTGRYGGQSGDEKLLSSGAGAKCYGGGGGGCGGGGGGGGDFDEQVSIGSFSESEKECSRLGGSVCEGGQGEDKENADGSSLVEGTPRRGRNSPIENQGGFYPPLQVANIAKKEPKGLSLSNLQRSTLQWMFWREGSEEAEGARGAERSGRSAAAATASSDSDNVAGVNVKGGVLGHLRPEEASMCVHALVHGGVASDLGAAGGKSDRARAVHEVTGLPCGATLIIAPTKEAVWQWSDRLESGVDGLSVLSYVMPLRERRRLSAKQAAAFDVVVTTYDVLKAKEVPREVKADITASPRSWALPGSKEWRTKHTKEEAETKTLTSKTEHMVSLLHGIWWDRVVADGAQLLANQRSARAVAALSLVGTARWCVVGRESMAVVENASERMRCLTAFLRIPAEVPMVEAAEGLFYHCRPGHVAPLHPRSCFGGADDSLSLSEGGEGQSSPGSSTHHRRRRPGSRRKSGSRGRGAGAGAGAGAGTNCTVGRKGKTAEDGLVVPAMKRNFKEKRREGRRSPPVVGEGGAEGRRSRSRRGDSSRVAPGGEGGSPENGNAWPGGGDRGGVSGGGGAVVAGRELLTRGDVTYAATTLRLRRARGETGPTEVGRNR